MSQIKELLFKKASVLKELLPLYPTVRREEVTGLLNETEIKFSTLVRKRYNDEYYLIPISFSAPTEGKAIHGIHSTVYKYLMLGVLTIHNTKDDVQDNEAERLYNLK